MYIRPLHSSLILLATVALLATALPLPDLVVAQGLDVTPTATALPNERPDACEPNADARRACVLPVDTVSGPFTFLPEGDQDYYSIFLGERPDGLVTGVSVRATSGLDLLTTITRADTGAVLSTIASPAISTTLAAEISGWVLLRVENRAPSMAMGQSYRVEMRRSLPPPPSPTPPPGSPDGLEREPATPDALENNYSPETAAPIGVGVVYELNFVCPVEGGCGGGDHDYLRFEAKASMRYLISTFDLAPGVDTVVELFWWSAAGGWQVVASNDDERPGAGFLSTLRWQAPGDGPAILRVGPRTGGLNPILVGRDSHPAYRVAIALAGSGLAAQLEERIAQQTGSEAPADSSPASPAPVPAAPATPATAGGGAPSSAPVSPTPMPVTTSAPSGAEVYLAEPAAVYIAPDPASAVLAELATDSLVTTTGMVSGLYAEVTSSTFVGAGWVNRRFLRLAQAPVVSDEQDESTPDAVGQTALEAPLPQAMATPGRGEAPPSDLVTRPLDPLPLPLPPAAPAPLPVQLTVTVQTSSGRPVAGVRLMLANIFGDAYVENVTGPDGAAQLTAAVSPGDALVLLVPAAGIQQRVGGDTTALHIVVPEEQ